MTMDLPAGTMTSAIDQAWQQLLLNSTRSDEGESEKDGKMLHHHHHSPANSIDLGQCMQVFDKVADIMGVARTELLSEQDRATFQNVLDLHSGEIGKLSRQEFNELFFTATGKEFNSRIISNTEDEEDSDVIMNEDTMESFARGLEGANTSTPMRKPKLVNNKVMRNSEANEVNKGFTFPAAAPSRSPKDVKVIDDQEHMLRQFEIQVSQLDEEKSKLQTELQRVNHQVRDLKVLERQKDTHIQQIETSLSETKRQLVDQRPKNQIVYRDSKEQQQLILNLRKELEATQQEKNRIMNEAKQISQPDYSVSDPNILQKLNMAAMRQKQILANCSTTSSQQSCKQPAAATVPDSLQKGVIIWCVLFIAMAYVTVHSTFDTTNPWWKNSILHHPASQVNSWAKPRPIS